MNRKAKVYFKEDLAGYLSEVDEGYEFIYDEHYFVKLNSKALSNTLPLQKSAYKSKVLFPFFDGLVPEGWLLDIAQENWKLNYRDRMGLLLACCKDCIGAVGVAEIKR